MKRFLSILLAILVLTFAMPLNASAAIPKLDYVSLGDSLAAGQTPYGAASGYGYSDILADRLEKEGVLGDYTKAGVSGYDTAELIAQLTTDMALRSDLSKAEIVTITIGANDLLKIAIWSQNFENLSTPAWIGSYPGSLTPAEVGALAMLYSDPMALLSAILEHELTYVGTQLAQILIGINGISQGKAKIYIMGYYDAIPEISLVRPLIEQLNGVIQGAAAYAGATYVPVMAAFDKHLYRYLPYQSDYPYQPLITRDIHPTVQGYRAIAQCFWTPIQNDFLRMN